MLLSSLEDSGRSFYTWNYVSALMVEDFRHEVMRTAWKHRPKAPLGLKKFATKAFLGAINVKGFRANSTRILTLAFNTVREGLIHSMMVDADVAAAIIGLWADSQKEVINHIHESAVITGFKMREGWTPEIARQGFYSINVIADFYDFASQLEDEKPEQWRNCLAALWLSSAFVAPEFVQDEPEPAADFILDDELLESDEEPTQPERPKSQSIVSESTVIVEADESVAIVEQENTETIAVSDLNLSVIDDTLSERIKIVERERNIATQYANDMHKAVKHSDPLAALEHIVELNTAMLNWQEAQTSLYQLETQVATFLRIELADRPDLPSPVAIEELDIEHLPPQEIEELGRNFVKTVEAIADYDTQKDKTLRICQQLLDEITTLIQQLDNPNGRLGDLPDITSDNVILQVARQWETKLRGRKKHLEDEIQSLRETLINQIKQQIDSLRERGVDPTQINLGENPDLSFREIERKKLPVLRTLRFILQTRMDDWIQQHTQDDRETAENVRERYSAESLNKLLEHLAGKQRDVEALLTLLSAYIVQNAKFDLLLSDAVVNSVLQGIQVLSDDSNGFSLLNRLAPVLLSKWECKGSFGQARLSLLLLGAEYESQRMPEGTLWQANIQQWSYTDMPEWSRLWNVALFNEDELVFVDGGDYQATIEKAKQAVEEALMKENGRFVGPSKIDSSRHSAMLASDLLPELVTMREKLEEIEDFMRRLSNDQIVQRAGQWASQLETMRRTLTKSKLEERYDTAMRDNGVRDKAQFHQKRTLRVYFECAETIADYAAALNDALTERSTHHHAFDKRILLDELSEFPELRQLAGQVIDRILSAPKDRPQRDAISSHVQAQQVLVDALLTRATYAARLPHLISFLVSHDAEYSEWADYLLTDLIEGHALDKAAGILLDAQAVNQVLLLNDIPVDMLKKAQNQQAEIMQEMDELLERLQRYDGTTDDLQVLRHTGRWGLLHAILQHRIREQEELRSMETEDVQIRVTDVYQRQSQIGMKLLTSAAIPQDIRQIVQEGLNLIQRSLAESHLFPGMMWFIEDMEYRLEHQSWSLSSVQDSLRKLKADATGITLVNRREITAERVLNLLERKELVPLGLSDEQMVLSKIETRSELLRSWLALKEMTVFATDQMTPEQRQVIDLLFRYFVQMTSMVQVKSQSGEHIRDNSLTISGLYALQYPKTDVLDTTCALITLPGASPKPSHLRDLRNFIDNKQWLPDYFVFMFIPGCTPELRERLEQEYRRQGMVVIDEERLLDMVLAEANASNPLGRLRSLMLNARHLAHIDIFKTNQLVDSVRSIFEGRGDVIQRIVTSGENYAIYGGRRIGKSSVLKALKGSLERRDYTVIDFSFEGMRDPSDKGSAMRLGFVLGLTGINDIEALYQALRKRLDDNPHLKLALILDEIDRYIEANRERHLLIETFRSLSSKYGNRFRIVVAGFMSLYNCLNQRYPNPYSSNSDPWVRTFEKEVLGNLTAENAEHIVREGFLGILGWQFKTRSIPQDIVKRTGGHPAFVQKFCEKVQRRVAQRGDQMILAEDLEEVFNDPDPERSFIAFVRETLSMNLDPVGEFVILWLAEEIGNARSFRLEQAEQIAKMMDVPVEMLQRSLETLKSTSVISKITPELYEFAVPDYPLILKRMGDTAHLDKLENKVKQYLENGANRYA
jgi:hypothetical protein